MKKIIYSIAAAAMMCGCMKEASTGTGFLKMNVKAEGQYIQVKSSEGVSTDDFQVSIRRGTSVLHSFEKYASMPEVVELAPGNYTVTAGSTHDLPAAFDQPVYYGEANFSLVEGQLVPIDLVCGISNMKVTFKPTEQFKAEFADYNISVTNAPVWNDGTRTLNWTKETAETDAGYFSVAPLMIKVDGYRTIDGSEIHVQYIISEVAPADHHIVTIDARATGHVGGISILVDDNLNVKNEGVTIPGWEEIPVPGDDEEDEPGSTDPKPSTAPSIEWTANPDFAETVIASVMDVNMTINAPEGIRDFLIDVDSEILSPIVADMGGSSSWDYAANGAYTMDLIGNEGLVSYLGQLNVPVKDQLTGQTSVDFSLSGLVPLIAGLSPEPGSKHIFILKLTDTKGQTLEKSLTFVMPESE